jgi:hypothetical protein
MKVVCKRCNEELVSYYDVMAKTEYVEPCLKCLDNLRNKTWWQRFKEKVIWSPGDGVRG